MRVWEIVIVASLAAFVMWPSVTGQPRRPFGWVPIIAALGALLMHIRSEELRWQLYPIYALVVVIAIATVWEIVSPSPCRRNRLLADGLSSAKPWVVSLGWPC